MMPLLRSIFGTSALLVAIAAAAQPEPISAAWTRTPLPAQPAPPASKTIICNGSDVGKQINDQLQTSHVATLSAGLCRTSLSIIMPSNSTLQGAGLDTTTLQLMPGVNKTLVQSENFEALHGKSAALDAPSGLNVKDLTLNGNYLAQPWKHPFNKILNSTGSCVALNASRYTLSARIDNCAEHLLLSENSGPRPPFEPASVINIYGAVAGKECLVWRGPGDSFIQTAMIGLCGILPLAQAQTQIAVSNITPATSMAGLLIDKSDPYDGTLEIGFAHIYGVFDGYAVRSLGNPRLKASHLVAESSAGALDLSSKTWGVISLLDIHRTGITHPNRKPALQGPEPPPFKCPKSMAVTTLLFQNSRPVKDLLFSTDDFVQCKINQLQTPAGDASNVLPKTK